MHTKFLPFSSCCFLKSVDLNFKQCNIHILGIEFLVLDCLPLFSHFHHPICGVFITVCFLSTIILTLLSSKFSLTILFSGMIWICNRMDQNFKISCKFLIHATFFSKWLQLYYYYNNPQLSLMMNEAKNIAVKIQSFTFDISKFYFEYFFILALYYYFYFFTYTTFPLGWAPSLD